MNRTSVRSFLGQRGFSLALAVVFIAMGVELLLLMRQNRELRTTVSEAREDLDRTRQQLIPFVRVGDRVPPLALPGLDGRPVHIDFDVPGQDTILLIFSPDCSACDLNRNSWERLHTGETTPGRRAFYVSTAGAGATRLFAEQRSLPEPVLIADRDSLIGYRITHIPTTLVIAPGGTIKAAWVGALPDGALH